MAVPFVSRIAGASRNENSICGPALALAVGTGRDTARFLGTSSPNTMDSEVASRIAKTSETPGTAPAGNRTDVSSGVSSFDRTGSAR